MEFKENCGVPQSDIDRGWCKSDDYIPDEGDNVFIRDDRSDFYDGIENAKAGGFISRSMYSRY